MASLTSIRNGLGTNLENISSLTVFKFVPDFVEPPTAVVGVVELIEYDITIQRGADKYEIPIYIYVSRVDAQDSQETLDSFCASTGSLVQSNPPIFTKPSFFALTVQPSASDINSRTMVLTDLSSYPISRVFMK